jgi:pimeloyl-ACP methyl ester carboxylesterase
LPKGVFHDVLAQLLLAGSEAAMALPDPVIVVPGITAAYLRDEYPVPPETVWAVLSKDYDRAALHPDDILDKTGKDARAFEATEPARVMPDQIFEIAYKELVEELRHNMTAKEDRPVPVYPFSYDWRQPLEAAAERLAAFVDEVIGRTALTRHYFSDGYADRGTVSLVGHSMGGLVITDYIARHGAERKVGKVATLASPFQGSFEVVVKVTTGTANLGTSPPSSREREAARLTPALYYLVPSFKSGLITDPGLPKSLFDPGLWQPSIVDTIAEYIRLHGRDPARSLAARQEQARQVFAAMLDAAKRHRERTATLDLAKAGLDASKWLAIVGVDATTRVDLKVTLAGNSPAFEFHQADRDNQWGNSAPQTAKRTGDGTVPFEGAVPPFLPYESLVCVTPDDFGFWEVADKVAMKAGGFHGLLPNMNMLRLLLARFFTGSGDPHGTTGGRPPPGVTDDAWSPPLSLKRKP